MNFHRGKGDTPVPVVYLPWIEELTSSWSWACQSSMPPLSRATSPSSSRRPRYQTVGSVRKRGSKPRRTALSLATSGLDLAGRLRVFQSRLRLPVERHAALIDVVRAVNTTLEP